MTAQTFIKLLKNSKNKLLEATSEDIMDWSKLKHNKECLELFLSYNIAIVKFNGDEYLVSSNLPLLSYLDRQRIVKNKNRVARVMSSSPRYSKLLKSKNQEIVRTWNLITNNKVEIPMNSTWSIVAPKWIGVNSSNSGPLAIAITEILEKGKIS